MDRPVVDTGGCEMARTGNVMKAGVAPQVMDIVFDPAGYDARWNDNDRRSWSVRQRSALNDYLVAEHRLPPHDGAAPLSEGIARIVRGWSTLRSAATYMAAARYARSVQASRCFPGLPPSVHAFMKMGFNASRHLPAGGVGNQAALVALGGASLEGLAPMLPAWLDARIALHFSDVPVVAFDPAPFDLPCFWSALSHAARHPL
jgi:type III secretion system (T3SS) protein OrgA/MxiK